MRQPWRARAGGALIVGLLLAAAAGTPFRVAVTRVAAPARLVESDQIAPLTRLTNGVALARVAGGTDRAAFLGEERASRSDRPDGAGDPPDADVAPIPADALPPVTTTLPPGAASGDAFASGAHVWPLHGLITGPFGGGRHHPGMDIDGNTGDPVRASAAGVVRIAGSAPKGYSGYGNVVMIDHGDGVATLYAHLSRVAVHAGQVVGTGDYIGAVGSTGHSTGSHLHFEVRRNGVVTNPAMWLRTAVR